MLHVRLFSSIAQPPRRRLLEQGGRLSLSLVGFPGPIGVVDRGRSGWTGYGTTGPIAKEAESGPHP